MVYLKVGGDPKPKGDFSLSQCYVTYIAGGPSEERCVIFLSHFLFFKKIGRNI